MDDKWFTSLLQTAETARTAAPTQTEVIGIVNCTTPPRRRYSLNHYSSPTKRPKKVFDSEIQQRSPPIKVECPPTPPRLKVVDSPAKGECSFSFELDQTPSGSNWNKPSSVPIFGTTLKRPKLDNSNRFALDLESRLDKVQKLKIETPKRVEKRPVFVDVVVDEHELKLCENGLNLFGDGLKLNQSEDDFNMSLNEDIINFCEGEDGFNLCEGEDGFNAEYINVDDVFKCWEEVFEEEEEAEEKDKIENAESRHHLNLPQSDLIYSSGLVCIEHGDRMIVAKPHNTANIHEQMALDHVEMAFFNIDECHLDEKRIVFAKFE
ncbi:unnamed protein product [Bursaphelenchus okinawaensis]|uniref:Uncharacterized protein n=1 Tax=Bursaphelenchus okinawaensis TaxID=465554 RepID=A0A811JVV3_9BILA|nr:unnamed protein product [Bursaphelenchus okinawaensis]CAG9086162.1 unnamed protein product [Bursaphelenchus okinawaensis]